MHYLLAERNKQANERIKTAVEVLAKNFDLPDDTLDSLNVHHSDLDKKTTMRAEAAANVLETIVAGHKEHKAKLREAKRDAKLANEEADAIQAQLAAMDSLRAQIAKLKEENATLRKGTGYRPEPVPATPDAAQPQETASAPSPSPAPTKAGGK